MIELADLGAWLLDWSDPEVGAAVATVRDSAAVVLATPTYKATFTGLLKLFLERSTVAPASPAWWPYPAR